MTAPRYCLLVCDGPSCGVQHDSDRLFTLATKTVEAAPGLRDKVAVRRYTCFGRCDDGPNTFVIELGPGDDPDREPDYAVLDSQRGFYPGMNEAKIVRVLEGHCGKDEVVEDLVDSY